MLNEAQTYAIRKFAEDIYERNGNAQEAKFFLTHKQNLGIRSVEFQPDGQVIVITNDLRAECLFYSKSINNEQNKKSK